MKSFWESLESESCLSGTAADWRRGSGEDFEGLRNAFFEKADRLSSSLFCENCCRNHVVFREDGSSPARAAEFGAHEFRYVAVDPGTDAELFCPNVPVGYDDLVMWRLSWSKLGRELCAALNLNSRLADMSVLNTRQIGSWSVDCVPVILTLQRDLHEVISAVSARLRQAFILLGGTDAGLDARAQELLANAGAEFFALERIITLEVRSDRAFLRSKRLPGEIFARFTPQPANVEEDLARGVFALVEQMDAHECERVRPSALTVFRHYCIDNLSIAETARKCRCSTGTVANRLNDIRRRTGMAPERLRTISAHLSGIGDTGG